MKRKMKIKRLIAVMLTISTLTAFSACNLFNQGTEYEDEEGGSEVGSEFIKTESADYNQIIGDAYGEEADENVQKLVDAFIRYREEVLSDPARQNEVTPEEMTIMTEGDASVQDVCTIEIGGRQMKYIMDIVGEPDENGQYPLYITLHGGGGASEELNNGQWVDMANYYKESVTSGIYVAVRGMEDEWNMHFLDDAYPMYDRLIEDMIIFKDADPNRVYLLGFSAGGDGVYAIAPRMADRFAAVNMSSGHPNDVCLLNVSNLPFEFQVGVRDFYSEDAMRCVKAAEFEGTLNDYSSVFQLEYPHRILVHVPEGHNFNDNYEVTDEIVEMVIEQGIDPDKLKNHVLTDPSEFARRAVEEDWLSQFAGILDSMGEDSSASTVSYDSPDGYSERIFEYVTENLGMEVKEEDTNAVHYVDSFTRNPIPQAFIWDLATRASKRNVESFYWLKADYSLNEGVIQAVYDYENNAVFLDMQGVESGEITILANPFLMDFGRPLTVVTENDEFTVDLEAKEDIIDSSIRETGDLYLAWADEIKVTIQ